MKDPITIWIMLAATFLLFGALGKILANKYKFILYNYPIFLLAGFILGHGIMLTAMIWDIQLKFNKAKPFAELIIQKFYTQVLFFYIGYSVNSNILKSNKAQMLILCFSANIIQTVITAYFAKATNIFPEFPNNCLLFICIICMPYSSAYSIGQLKNSTVFTNHVQQILESETLTSTTTALMLYHILISLSSRKTSISGIILGHIKDVSLCCIIGITAGMAIGPIAANSDSSALLCFTIGSIYLTFVLAYVLMDNYVEISAMILGIAIARDKNLSDKKRETYLSDFWKWKFYIIEIFNLFLAGINLSLRFKGILDDTLKSFIIFLASAFIRTLIWLCFYPLMNLIFGYRLSLRITIICINAAYKSTIPMLIALNSIAHGLTVPDKIESIVILVVFFHCLSSSILFPLIYKYFGLTGYSRKRILKIKKLLDSILVERQKTITNLQHNIVSANSNWQVVDQKTTIHNPKFYQPNDENETGSSTKRNNYKCVNPLANPDITLKDHDSVELNLEREVNIHEEDSGCQELNRSSNDLLAGDNQPKLYLENRIRKYIIDIETMSYNRQMEEEIISKKIYSELTSKCDVANLKDSLKLDKQFFTTLYRYLIRKLNSYQQIFWKGYLKPPVNCFRLCLYQLISSPSYKLLLTTVIILDSAVQLVLVILYYSRHRENYAAFAESVQMADHFCYGLFLGEFIFQIIGWGFNQYFHQKIWLIEFSASIVIRTTEQILFFLEPPHYSVQQKDILQVNEMIIFLKCMLIVRFVTVTQFFENSPCNYFKKILEDQQMKNITKIYEKNCGIVISHDDVIPFYARVFGLTEIGTEVKSQWLKRRSIIKTDNSRLADNNKNAVVAMKSRYVGISILKEEELYMEELKRKGQIFEYESRIFERNIKTKKETLRKITTMPLPKPDILFQEIYWMRGDYSCKKYLLKHAEVVTFAANECIVDFKTNKSSLIMITSGSCKYFYKPNPKSLRKLIVSGVLPNSDYYVHLRFQEKQKDIIESGNLIGELGIATGRAYDVRISCQKVVNAISIQYKYLAKQFYNCPYGNIRIAKLWKTIGIRLSVKHFAPHFKTLSRHSLILQLHKSLVPLLEKIKIVAVNEDISDIILIEGIATDSLTRCKIFAPRYIKPQGQKLLVNNDLGPDDVTARIMLVPRLGANINDIINSNKIFKDYLKYTIFVPNFVGEAIKINKEKQNVLKEFLKKQSRYMMTDFILQINDPQTSIPCCTSDEIIKKRRHTKKNKARIKYL